MTGIKPPKGQIEIDFYGGVNEIADLIISKDSDKGWIETTNEFSRQFKGLELADVGFKLWKWVRDNIRYKEDSRGLERIKSPSRLFYDGVGDCKSMALFVGSVLKNLGIPYFYRLVWYDKEHPNLAHIYVIAKAGSQKIVIDPVNPSFNSELDFYKKKDMETRIQAISGIRGNTAPFPGTTQTQGTGTTVINTDPAKTDLYKYALIGVILFFILKK